MATALSISLGLCLMMASNFFNFAVAYFINYRNVEPGQLCIQRGIPNYGLFNVSQENRQEYFKQQCSEGFIECDSIGLQLHPIDLAIPSTSSCCDKTTVFRSVVFVSWGCGQNRHPSPSVLQENASSALNGDLYNVLQDPL